MPNDKETVTLRLPSGENVDFVVPGGMSDAEVRTFVLSKRPDLFKPVTAPTAPVPIPAGLQGVPTERAMQQGIGGPPMFVDVPQGTKQQFEEAGQKGYAKGGRIGLGMLGGAIGGELAAGTGLLGTAAGVGGGTGLGDIAGQAASQGNVDVKEAAKTGVIAGATSLALAPVAKFINALAGKERAAPLFAEVSQKAGQNVVDTSGPMAVAQQAKQLQNAGFTMPRVISRFLVRIQNGTPLTFDEARNFEQAAGGKLAPAEAARLKPQMFRQLSMFADEMRKSTMQAAGQSGQAGNFASALKQYGQGAAAQDQAEVMKEVLKEYAKTALKGAILGGGGTAAYKLLK